MSHVHVSHYFSHLLGHTFLKHALRTHLQYYVPGSAVWRLRVYVWRQNKLGLNPISTAHYLKALVLVDKPEMTLY